MIHLTPHHLLHHPAPAPQPPINHQAVSRSSPFPPPARRATLPQVGTDGAAGAAGAAGGGSAGTAVAAAAGDTAGTAGAAVGGAVIRGGVGLKGKQETTKGEQTSICVNEPIKGNV